MASTTVPTTTRSVATSTISYEADGRTMIGTLAVPEGIGRTPGVLVCHEGPGLDDYARSIAARLAADRGYVAFALDYHGGGEWLPDRDQMMARIGELSVDPLRTRADAGRIERDLGFRPATPIQQGLEAEAEWARELGLGALA